LNLADYVGSPRLFVYCCYEVENFWLGEKVNKNLMPLQPGDVPQTYANVDDVIKEVGFTECGASFV